MANLIITGFSTPGANATGTSGQGHIVYAVNQGAWWVFYLISSNQLAAKYSTDGVTWNQPGGSPFTLAQVHNSTGRNFGFGYGSIGTTDVLHASLNYFVSGSTKYSEYARFTLGVSWTKTSGETSFGNTGSTTTGVFAGASVTLDSSNYPFLQTSYNPPNSSAMVSYAGTNADTGTAWTAGYGTPTDTLSGNNWSGSSAVFPLASRGLLVLNDNGDASNTTFNTLTWNSWNGTTWSQGTSFPSTNLLASSVTSTSQQNWGAAKLSNTDIHVFCLSNNSNTFVHRRWNGTSWANGNTPNTLTIGTNSGIALASDGTYVWAFVTDSSNNVQYSKWVSGTGWGVWTVLEATRTNAPSFLTACYSSANSAIQLAWTELNGSQYEIWTSQLSTISGSIVANPGTVSSTSTASATSAALSKQPANITSTSTASATSAALSKQPANITSTSTVLAITSTVSTIAIRASGAVNYESTNATPTTKQTVTKPTGTVVNDLMVVCVSVGAAVSSIVSITIPSTWTAISNNIGLNTSGSGEKTTVCYRIMQSGDTTWSFGPFISSTDSTTDVAIVLQSFSGVNPSNPIDAIGTANTNTGSLTLVSNAVVAVNSTAWLVIGCGSYNNGASPVYSAPGMTEYDNSPNTDESTGLLYRALTNNGSTGTLTVTTNGTASGNSISCIPFTLAPISGNIGIITSTSVASATSAALSIQPANITSISTVLAIPYYATNINSISTPLAIGLSLNQSIATISSISTPLAVGLSLNQSIATISSISTPLAVGLSLNNSIAIISSSSIVLATGLSLNNSIASLTSFSNAIAISYYNAIAFSNSTILATGLSLNNSIASVLSTSTATATPYYLATVSSISITPAIGLSLNQSTATIFSSSVALATGLSLNQSIANISSSSITLAQPYCFGTISSISTTPAIGLSLNQTIASTTSISTILATGLSLNATTATISSSSTALANSFYILTGTGTGMIASTSNVLATGLSLNATTATISSISIISATGLSLNDTTATISSISTTPATGLSLNTTIATISSISTVLATNYSYDIATATISSISTVSAISATLSQQLGTISSISTTPAIGLSLNQSTAIITSSSIALSISNVISNQPAIITSISIVSAIGLSLNQSIATISSISMPLATGLTLNPTTATTTSISTTPAIGLSLNQSIATISSISIVTAIPYYNAIVSSISTTPAIGLSLNSSIATINSTSTILATGLSLNSSIVYIYSISTPLAIGLSLNPTTATTTSVSSALAIGLSLNQSIASISSVSTVLATGLSLNQSTAAISSISITSAVPYYEADIFSISTALATPYYVVNSLSISTTLATGLSLNQSIGTISSVSVVSGESYYSAAGFGTGIVYSTSNVLAIGLSFNQSIATISSISTSTAISLSLNPSVANVTSLSTTLATGLSLNFSEADVTSISIAFATGHSLNLSEADAISLSIVSGVGLSLNKSIGTITTYSTELAISYYEADVSSISIALAIPYYEINISSISIALATPYYIANISSISTVLATGTLTNSNEAYINSVSTVDAIGLSLNSSEANVTSLSTTLAIGLSLNLSEADVSSTSIALATGLSIIPSEADVASISIASAIGLSLNRSEADAFSTSTSFVTSISFSQFIGIINSSSIIDGESSYTASGIGTGITHSYSYALAIFYYEADVTSNSIALAISYYEVDIISISIASAIPYYEAKVSSISNVSGFSKTAVSGTGSVLGLSVVGGDGASLYGVMGNVLSISTVYSYSPLNIFPNPRIIGKGYNIMTEPKNCSVVSEQCVAEGIDTTAGLSLYCTIENGQLAIIPNYTGNDFYSGVQVGLYNLEGGSSPTTQLITNVNTVSIYNTINTLITFPSIITNHTSGIISLIDSWASHSEGYQTIAFGKYSHAGGVGAVADLPSKFAWSDNTNNSQYSTLSLNALTIDATPTPMVINNNYQFTIRTNMTYTLFIHIAARDEDGSQHAYFIRQGLIHNENGILSIIGIMQHIGTDINPSGWNISITSSNILNIIVTGASGTIIKWFAKVETLEL